MDTQHRQNHLRTCLSAAAMRIALSVFALLLAAGCRKVGPDYVAPATPMPDLWYQEISKDFGREEPALQEWWTHLEDPLLADLIRRCRENNLTIKQASSVIREARFRRTILSKNLQPNIDINASYTRTKASETVPPLSLVPKEVRNAEGFNVFSAGFDMAWEIDFFGRIRRSIEAADAGVGATIEGYRDILVTLFAEVGRTYVDVRTLQQRISFAQQNIERQRGTLKLVESRYEAGLVGQLDVQQARSNLANTEAVLPQLRLGLQASLNQLTFLLSLEPGSLHDQLETPAPIPGIPADVALGLPAELLRQRPDIRGAERLLAAETARIGVVTADLYPRFGLVGDLTSATVDLGNVGGSGTFAITPFMGLNIFNRGRIRNAISAQEESTEQALLSYENTVLFALTEVESSLAGFQEERNRRDAIGRAVEAVEKAAGLVHVLYDTGLTDFQNVLDTERSLFLQQDQLVASQGQVVKDLIALYKALGGGWSPAVLP